VPTKLDRLKPINPVPIDPRDPLAQGLVADWPLWERSGGTVRDSVSGLVGTLNGGVTWGAGPSGPCLDFDGASGSLTAAGLAYSAAVSFRCRFRITPGSNNSIASQSSTASPPWPH
jgi:hypothetical protein